MLLPYHGWEGLKERCVRVRFVRRKPQHPEDDPSADELIRAALEKSEASQSALRASLEEDATVGSWIMQGHPFLGRSVRKREEGTTVLGRVTSWRTHRCGDVSAGGDRGAVFRLEYLDGSSAACLRQASRSLRQASLRAALARILFSSVLSTIRCEL